jgi:CheY-like chemotaxis protein
MRKTSSAAEGQRANILLVDDHKMGLAARRALLEEVGHAVVTAGNGLAALDAVEKQSFDLVVTDWRMPKMDGLELIRQLRAREFAAPIILISGFADFVGAEEKSGADVVLHKTSHEVPQLLAAVKRLLQRKPARKMPGVSSTPSQTAPAVEKPARAKSKIS